jgi:hypothetical protein
LALKEGAIKLGGKGRAGILDKCGRRRESSLVRDIVLITRRQPKVMLPKPQSLGTVLF